jgi:hypothetical protein
MLAPKKSGAKGVIWSPKGIKIAKFNLAPNESKSRLKCILEPPYPVFF